MSTPHVTENLPGLLTGEATREQVLAAAAHLRSCPDCQQELVSAVAAHAALRSAHRFAPEVVAPAVPTVPDEPAGPLPDLSAVFAQARAEATPPPARSNRTRWLVAAAAAVVVAGGGVTIAETVGTGPGQPAGVTVALRPVGDLTASAKAVVTGDTMRIDATALPRLDPSRQYEVWLAGGPGQLRAVGYIGSSRTASLPVPSQVMARYRSIAISVQQTNQIAFSGDMVVRGDYG